MSDYENAPATAMLATHCCCCHRPLVDSKSVEMGIGPDCRAKYGFDIPVSGEARRKANKIVHKIAALVSAGLLGLDLLQAAEELTGLGFAALAKIIQLRAASVTIELREDGRLWVRVPYNPEFNQISWVHGRKGTKVAEEGKKKPIFYWTFPNTLEAKRVLFAALQQCYQGQVAVGPKGGFVVETVEKAA
jgi:hypothetical protein